MNNLTHAQRTTLTSHPHTHKHTLTLAHSHAMWGNICLLGTLTIFGYLHLICIARNATRLLLLLLLLRPPTTTPTPLGMTTTTTTPLLYSMHCSVYPCGVPNDWRTALRRPINFRHVTANYTFSIFAPHTFYLSFLFCAASLSLSLALSHAVAETTNQPGKTATIEMYAPSSYNDTVTGETLSSVSEKSESYSNEGSQPEYIVSIHTHTLSDKRISRVFSSIAPLRFSFSFFFFLWRYMNMQFLTMGKNVD